MKNGTVSVFGEAIERTAKERAHLIKLLKDSQKEYLSYVENVSEAQWNWKPGQDRWSVGEPAEHILLAEGRFFSAVERAVAARQILIGRRAPQARLSCWRGPCLIAATKRCRLSQSGRKVLSKALL